jgi:peptidoglycan/LPS O-acetylase OafA/YrhL
LAPPTPATQVEHSALTQTAPKAVRLPGLDGLRAVAVALVILAHQWFLPCGWIGVQIFFTLSGYLITGILFRSRLEPLGHYLRDFYGRRSLRIFPLYFGIIVAFWLATLFGYKLAGLKGLPYAATYTYNIWHASSSFVHSPLLTHFWSLCVEEQFYLVWPFLVFFCPARHVGRVLLGLMIAGPVVRALLLWSLSHTSLPVLGSPYVALYVLTPTHIDAFAAGGYLALFPLKGSGRALLCSVAAVAFAGLSIVAYSHDMLTTAAWGFPLGMAPAYSYLWGISLLNVTSALLIDFVAHRAAFAAFLDAAVLKYLGKISYGLYIFHYPLQSLVAHVLPRSGHFTQLVVQCALTVIVATGSFHLWEAPFSRLKDMWFPNS